MSIRYFEHKELSKAKRELRRAGGRMASAANEVDAIRGRITAGENPFLGIQQTKHGESRIPNCLKYDLPGYARLVTVRYNEVQILLYLGDHEATDRWINKRKGLRFYLDEKNLITEITVSAGVSENLRISARPSDVYQGSLISRLNNEYRTKLLGDLPARMTEPLHDIMAGASEQQIEYAVRVFDDESLQATLFDVLVMLNSGDIEGAKTRIDVWLGTIQSLDNISSDEQIAVLEGENIKLIRLGSLEYEEWYQKTIYSLTYQDWFLFMHPEQERYINDDYSGPTKLSGVSGSGKTCIAVRRATRVAQRYPGEIVAIVTLNRSLAALISQLVDHICADLDIRKRIEVTSFFELCQRLLQKFEPKNEKIYHDVTWKLDEHIDEIFREYYRGENNYKASEIMLPLHRGLISRGIDAETYVREEFDWIRSALLAKERDSYLSIERHGRGLPLDKERRKELLLGLFHWEEKMRSVGVIDYMGLTTALSKHRDSLKPIYRCIIVDEAQDFGTSELALLRNLVPHGENDMFFCGDLAQHILPKHQSFIQAGIEVTGRSHSIKRNYRNSREILNAAYAVLVNNLDESLLKAGEMDILDPQFANRSSANPVVLEATSIEEEISAAIALVRETAAMDRYQERPHRGCLAIAGHSLYEISIFGERNSIPVLDGARGILNGDLFLSDLEQTKGYEFDTVVIINCRKEVLPPQGTPPDEVFRFGSQLYVAMTRATEQLVLSFSGTPSEWLLNDKTGLSFYRWEDYIDLSTATDIGAPPFLPERVDAGTDDVMELNGREFLFTRYAMGLPGGVQARLEAVVTGETRLRGRNRVTWKNVGQLLADLKVGMAGGRTGHILGPKADDLVREILERAQFGLRPVARRQIKSSNMVLNGDRASPLLSNVPIEEGSRIRVKSRGWLDRSIRELKLSTKTYVKLHERKIYTIADLVDHRARDFFYLTGQQLSEVKRKLATRGLTLR